MTLNKVCNLCNLYVNKRTSITLVTGKSPIYGASLDSQRFRCATPACFKADYFFFFFFLSFSLSCFLHITPVDCLDFIFLQISH